MEARHLSSQLPIDSFRLRPIWVLWALSIVVVIFLLNLDLDLASTSGPVIGRVELTRGKVSSRGGELSLWKRLDKSNEVREGSWVRTGRESGVAIALNTGELNSAQ